MRSNQAANDAPTGPELVGCGTPTESQTLLKLRRTLLGALLIEEGLVTPEQLEVALAEQRRGDGTKRLGEILI